MPRSARRTSAASAPQIPARVVWPSISAAAITTATVSGPRIQAGARMLREVRERGAVPAGTPAPIGTSAAGGAPGRRSAQRGDAGDHRGPPQPLRSAAAPVRGRRAECCRPRRSPAPRVRRRPAPRRASTRRCERLAPAARTPRRRERRERRPRGPRRAHHRGHGGQDASASSSRSRSTRAAHDRPAAAAARAARAATASPGARARSASRDPRPSALRRNSP